VAHGRVLLQPRPAGAEDARQLHVNRIAQAGEVLGLSSAISSNAYKSTAETMEPSRVNGKDVDNGMRIQRLMTHEDISQLIGTSRETVTRLLKEFRLKKIASIKGSSLTVHDKAALEALVVA
jgi:CRP-like cAMP-binding protein